MNSGNAPQKTPGQIQLLCSEFENFLRTNNLSQGCIAYLKDDFVKVHSEIGFNFSDFPKETLRLALQNNSGTEVIDIQNKKFAIVPLFLNTPIKAAIVFGSLNKRFSIGEIDPESLTTIRVAVALDYTIACQKARESAEKQNAMADAAMQAVLKGFLGKENNFQSTLNFLLRLFNWKVGSLWEFHDNEQFDNPSYLTLEATCNHDIELYKHNCLKRGQGIIWKVLEKGAPKLYPLENVKKEDLANQNVYEPYYNQPLLLLRLEVDGKVYGAACLNGLRPQEDTDLDRHLKTFESVMALELKARSLEGRAVILKRINDILIKIGKKYEDVCMAAANDLISLLNCEAVSIFLKPELSPNAKELFLTAVTVAEGVQASDALREFQQGKSVIYEEDDNSLTGAVAKRHKTILDNEVLSNLLNSGRFRETADRTNQTWLGKPLLSADHCVGVIRCAGKRTRIAGKQMPYIFDSFDEEVVTIYAKLLVPALELVTSIKSLERQRDQLQLAAKIREHEMTAPLAGISSNAGFVSRHLSDAGVTSKPRLLKGIISDAEMCAFLLKTHKIPSGESLEEALRYISVSNVAVSVAKFLRRQIEQRSNTATQQDEDGSDVAFKTLPFMRVNVIGTIPYTMGVRHLLQRAFYNLGINAVKYGKPNGQLNIKMHEDTEQKTIVIEFQDDGIGIPEEDKNDIFNEGFRGRNVREKYKNTGEGLGLTIARDIIEAHNGRLELINCSSPTLFRLVLPLVRLDHDSNVKLLHPSIIRADRFVRYQE